MKIKVGAIILLSFLSLFSCKKTTIDITDEHTVSVYADSVSLLNARKEFIENKIIGNYTVTGTNHCYSFYYDCCHMITEDTTYAVDRGLTISKQQDGTLNCSWFGTITYDHSINDSTYQFYSYVGSGHSGGTFIFYRYGDSISLNTHYGGNSGACDENSSGHKIH